MAKTLKTGADTEYLLAFESGYGVPPTDGYVQTTLRSIGLDDEKALDSDPLLGQGRDSAPGFYNGVTVSGPLTVPLDLRLFGYWLKAVFGAPVAGGAGPYDHVFTSGAPELPSFTLQQGHLGVTPPEFDLFSGCKAGDLRIGWELRGRATADIEVIAQQKALAAVSVDATPTTEDFVPFMRSRGAVTVDGASAADLTAGSFEYSNNLTAIETIRDDGLIDGVSEGDATARGTVTVRLNTDTTFTGPIAAETPVALSFKYSLVGAENYSLTIDLPQVLLSKPRGGFDGPGGRDISYDWIAAKDPVAGHMCQVTLRNDVAGYS